LPFTIAAVDGAGNFRDAQRGGIKRYWCSNQIADSFGVRIVEVTLDDIGGISPGHGFRK
jgi:hypothetical protein